MQPVFQRSAARTGGEYDGVVVESHFLGVDDFIGLHIFEHAVLVDAARMGESVAPHDGLVGLHGHVHQARHQARCGANLRRVDVGVDAHALVAFEYHGYLFERRVAGALTDAVDRHLHLPRPVEHTLQGVGRGHAQVVVAVGGEHSLVYPVHVLHQVFYLVPILLGQTVARGVGYVDYCGSGLDDGLHHTGEVFIVGAPGILGIELHILYISLGILHGGHGALDDFLAVGVEFVFDVRVARPDAGVYALVLGILEGFGRAVDVFLHGTCQRADGGPSHGFGYFYHRVEVARTRNGEARLYHIHAQLLQCLSHLYFLYRVQLATGHLFTVAQCRVKNE